MKTSYIKTGLKRLVTTTVAVWLGGLALSIRADSPVGNWDFYFSGDQKGVAQINFYPDFTLDGIEVSSPGKLPKIPPTNPRSPVVNDPRGGVADPNLPYVFITGTSGISGHWGYDTRGRVIGVMILTSTNVTNGWSFTGVAKGVSGTKARMTITTHHNTSIGLRSVLRGVLRGAPLPSIAGTGGYAEAGKMLNRINLTSQGYSRILTLAPSGYQNIYDVQEAGPGYIGGGFAILTRNNRLGIYTEHFEPGTTNLQIIVVSGTFNTNKLTGTLSGYDGVKHSISTKIWAFPNSP
jgi:hypothetical protein